MFDAIEHFMERAKESTGDEQDGHILAAVPVAVDAQRARLRAQGPARYWSRPRCAS
jgi:hypothetical protein